MDEATLWTGTLRFQLIDAVAQPTWRLSVVLRREMATFWSDQRNLGVFDREPHSAWASNGSQAIERHDLGLTRVDQWIAVHVDDGPPHWLTPDDAARLRSVL